MNNLKNEIHDYWTNRARGYSEYNQQEMADARQTMWRAKLLDLLGKQFPEREPKEIKILDVGTGPGFFAILLAEAGYQVQSNKEHGEGRSDVIVCDSINGRVAIFEAKRTKEFNGLENQCNKALQQIDERRYAEDFEDAYDHILCYGISFYKKRCLVKKK